MYLVSLTLFRVTVNSKRIYTYRLTPSPVVAEEIYRKAIQILDSSKHIEESGLNLVYLSVTQNHAKILIHPLVKTKSPATATVKYVELKNKLKSGINLFWGERSD